MDVYAEDNVENVGKIYLKRFDFLTARVYIVPYNDAGTESTVSTQEEGQEGILKIHTTGCSDKLQITFYKKFSGLDNTLNKTMNVVPKAIFKNNVIKLKLGDTFNMVLDNKQKVTRPGGFALLDDVPSRAFARNDMAIKYGWKDDCGKIAIYRVKEGSELNALSEPIGPQIDLGVDKYLPGNMSLTQLDLFNGLGEINRNDYIEVVHGSVRKLR